MINDIRNSWRPFSDQILALLNQCLHSPTAVMQVLIIAGSFLAAFVMSWIIQRVSLPRLRQEYGEDSLWVSLAHKWASYAMPLLTAIILELAALKWHDQVWPCQLITITAKLAWAWLLVRLFTSFIANRALARTMALVVYALLILEFTGLLLPLTQFLDQFGFQVEKERLSVLSLFKASILLFFLLSFINFILRFLESRLPKTYQFSPRGQILLLKTIRLALYTLTIIVALDTAGLDFYLVSVFSGAIGLGLGFGLQRVVANFFSGFVILMDRSIRPGDVIETNGLYGWIESLHGRFVSLVTRDGKSHLIPNEQLITDKVINWSFSNPNVRIKIPVGISYDSDLHVAMEQILAAAGRNPRVLKYPPATARLISFGDSAINLELRIWINDPQHGLAEVTSSIQVDIWDAFRAHGVSFPFPQRDVHLRTPQQLIVVVEKKDPPPEEEPPS